MAKVKPEHAKCSRILTSFRGLGSVDMFVDDGAQEMVNFRITDEGNLEKREGIRLLNYTYAIILYKSLNDRALFLTTFLDLSFPRQLIKSVTELFNSY